MKDSKYVEEDWADGLKNRLRLDDPPTPNPTRASQPSVPFAKREVSTPMAEFEVARNATRSLVKMRDLPPTATLLLFTPVMLPVGFSDNQTEDSKPSKSDRKAPEGSANTSRPIAYDPFESLGKALNKHHRRIRHVPYVPSVGFTDTHDVFVRNAAAVIVVTCVPENAASDIETILAKESEFVSNVMDALEEAEHNVPLVNFGFGSDDWMSETPAYNHIWAGETYDAESVANVVKMVFGK